MDQLISVWRSNPLMKPLKIYQHCKRKPSHYVCVSAMISVIKLVMVVIKIMAYWKLFVAYRNCLWWTECFLLHDYFDFLLDQPRTQKQSTMLNDLHSFLKPGLNHRYRPQSILALQQVIDPMFAFADKWRRMMIKYFFLNQLIPEFHSANTLRSPLIN